MKNIFIKSKIQVKISSLKMTFEIYNLVFIDNEPLLGNKGGFKGGNIGLTSLLNFHFR